MFSIFSGKKPTSVSAPGNTSDSKSIISKNSINGADNKENKRDANWFDVGIIKGSSCTVSSYYLPSGMFYFWIFEFPTKYKLHFALFSKKICVFLRVSNLGINILLYETFVKQKLKLKIE